MAEDLIAKKDGQQNPWFLLATVTGVPKSELQEELIAENARHWNSAMCHLYPAATQAMCDRVGKDPSEFRGGSTTIDNCATHLSMHGISFADLKAKAAVIDLRDTTFQDPLMCVGFVFPLPLDMARSTFARPVSFRGAMIGSQANALDVTFKRDVDFVGARFARFSVFGDSAFEGHADFSGAIFHDPITFQGTHFLGRADFQSASFEAAVSFERTSFRSVPIFFGTKFHENMEWDGAIWPTEDTLGEGAARSVSRYERLALEMDKLQRYEDRHFFFRLAMRARRARDGRRSFVGGLNRFYEALADYGFGVREAVRAWAVAMFVGWLLLYVTAFRDGLSAAAASKTWQQGWIKGIDGSSALSDLVTALAVSFANSHAILGLNRVFMKLTYNRFDETSSFSAGTSGTAMAAFNIIGGVQTVTGAIMLFFVLLTLRNRFRMG